MKEIRLHVTDDTHKKLKQIAKEQEIFLATLVRAVLVDFVRECDEARSRRIKDNE